MDQSILEIILRARDEASSQIKAVGDAVEDAKKKTQDMSSAFKAAGGILVGVGIAGVGVMSQLVEAAAKHQQVMASVDATLKNVASSQGTYTEVVGGSTSATALSKKAIQEQIQALELQKSQLTLTNAETTQSVTVTTGHGKTLKEHTKIVHQDAAEITAQKNAIDQQIISLKAQELGIGKSGATQSTVTKIIDNASMSYQSLAKTTDDVSEAYLKLGFAENDTAPAFAQDLRITGNVADAKTMLAAAADYARLKNEDLGTATQQLSMAYAGQSRALKELGIDLPKGTKGMEAISAVTKAASGQAQAFAHTYEGATQVLSANFDSLKEKLGARLLPTFTQFVLSISNVIDKLNNLNPKTYDTIVNVLKFGTAFALIAGPILLVIGFLPSLVAGFAIFSGVALPLIAVLAAVALGGYLLYTNWGSISPLLSKLVKDFSQFWTVVEPQIMGFINRVITSVQNFVKQNQDTFNNFFATVKGIFIFSLGFIEGFWSSTWQSMYKVLQGIWQMITGLFQIGWGLIEIIFAVGMGLFTGNWTKAWQSVQKGFSDIWKGIQNEFEGFMKVMLDGIISFANSFIGVINGIIKGANAVGKTIPGGKSIPTIPSIPAYEQGGYVPNTGLALLHAGEFVLSKNMLSGSSPTPQQISTITNNKTPINIYATINSDMDMNLLGNKLAFAVRNAR